MKKIIIFSILLFAGIVFMAIKYFGVLNASSSNHIKALRLIPSSSGMIMSLNNDEAFYDLMSDYKPFEAAAGKGLDTELSLLHNLLLKDLGPDGAADGWKLFLSFHPSKGDSVNVLYCLALNPNFPAGEALDALRQKTGQAFKDIGNDTFQISFDSAGRRFFLYVHDDIVLGSFTRELLDEAITDSGKKIRKSYAERINDNVLKNLNSPVGVYFDHESGVRSLKQLFRGKPDGNSALLQNLAGQTALTMNFKSDAIMLNGLSSPDTSRPAYLNIFLQQQTALNQIKGFIPTNTANFLSFSLSNTHSFNAALKQYFYKKGELKALEANVKAIKKATGLDVDRDIKPFLGNEFVLIENMNRERYALIKLKDGMRMAASLRLVSGKISDNISQFSRQNILHYCFGDPFKSFIRPYYAVIDNFLIIANTTGVISQYLSAYSQTDFLSKNKNFTDHQQLVANKCNVYYFVNIKNSSSVFRKSLRGRYASLFDEAHSLKDFYGLSLQWSADGPNFQVNVYANYIEPANQELKEAWNIKLDANVSTVFGLYRSGNGKAVLVQDLNDRLYAISETGTKIWQTSINGKVMGDITQLDDNSIVFNTSNKLYRLDTLGVNLTNFPVSINYLASEGLACSSTNTGEARFFIPAYNLIMGFDAQGRTLEGWEQALPTGILNNILVGHEHNASFIMAANNAGRFYFLDLKGKIVKDVRVAGNTLFRGKIFFKNPSLRSPEFICADTAGLVYDIAKNGQVSIINNGTNSPADQFAWSNVTGDIKPDIILVDDKQLSVLSNEAIPVFSYTFERTAGSYNLEVLSSEQGENMISLSAKNGRKRLIFDDEGNLRGGFPERTQGRPAIGTLRTDGGTYLFCGSDDGKLHAFRL